MKRKIIHEAYDIQTRCWIRLELTPKSTRLLAFRKGDWHESTLPEEPITVWDRKAKKTFVYFIYKDRFYRYFQKPIQAPSSFLDPKYPTIFKQRLLMEKLSREIDLSKLSRRDPKYDTLNSEISDIEQTFEKRLKARTNKHQQIMKSIKEKNGFIHKDKFEKRSAWEPCLEQVGEGAWKSADIKIIKHVNLQETPLPKTVNPHEPYPTTKKNSDLLTHWNKRRKKQIEFDDEIQTEIPKLTRDQLDEHVNTCLNFKEIPRLKRAEYITAIEALLGEKASLNALKKTHIFNSIKIVKILIRKALYAVRSSDRIGITADQASLYVLTRVAQVYTEETSRAFPQEIGLRHLSNLTPETAEDFDEILALQIYQNLLAHLAGNPFARPIDIRTASHIWHHLRPSGLPTNIYTDVAHNLSSEIGPQQAAIFCLNAILKSLNIQLSEEETHTIIETGLVTEEIQNISSNHTLLHALLNVNFALTFLDKPESRIYREQLPLLAHVHHEFIQTLPDKPHALATLSSSTLVHIVKAHPDLLVRIAIVKRSFAHRLPRQPNLLRRLTRQSAVSIIAARPALIRVFRNNQQMLRYLPTDTLCYIAELDRTVAQSFIDKYIHLLFKLPTQALSQIGSAHGFFLPNLFMNRVAAATLDGPKFNALANSHDTLIPDLINNEEALKALKNIRLVTFAEAHEGFALALLDSAIAMNKLHPGDFKCIAMKHESVALASLDNIKLLDILKSYLKEIIEAHPACLQALPHKPRAIATLGYEITKLAIAHESFALAALNNDGLLDILKYDLKEIIKAHPALLTALGQHRLFNLAKSHQDVALAVLENDEAIALLGDRKLKEIILAHRVCFTARRQTPQMIAAHIERRARGNLATLAPPSHPPVFLKKAKALAVLSASSICEIVEANPDLLPYLTEDPLPFSVFTKEQLKALALAHKQFAHILLGAKEILAKLDGEDILEIAKKHPSIFEVCVRELRNLQQDLRRRVRTTGEYIFKQFKRELLTYLISYNLIQRFHAYRDGTTLDQHTLFSDNHSQSSCIIKEIKNSSNKEELLTALRNECRRIEAEQYTIPWLFSIFKPPVHMSILSNCLGRLNWGSISSQAYWSEKSNSFKMYSY